VEFWKNLLAQVFSKLGLWHLLISVSWEKYGAKLWIKIFTRALVPDLFTRQQLSVSLNIKSIFIQQAAFLKTVNLKKNVFLQW